MRRALLVLCVIASAASAQQAGAPAPVLRATIDPPKVTVGQPTTLTIEVLAPNYMTRQPAVPDFQLHNAVTRAASRRNLTEQRDGVSYAGVAFEFSIYPQEPGSYAVGGQEVAVTYAAEPPATREATLPVPALTFQAVIPDAARALDPFVAADRLALRQEVKQSSQDLKVGDAVTRTVTVEATGTPAMLLPPTAFAALDGAKIYPAQPDLQDKSDQRTGVVSATRVDQATYMLQRPGEIALPAIELRWWNTREQTIERASVDRIVLRVADDPALRPNEAARTPSRRAIVLALADHWTAVLAALAALAALAWLVPRAARRLREWTARRRDAYRRSEAFSFAALRAAARHGDAGRTYFALLDWLARFAPAAPDHTLEALKRAAHDPALDRELARIERRLFAAEPPPDEWSPRRLMQRVAAARRRLRRRTETARALPTELNPARGTAHVSRRPVAR